MAYLIKRLVVIGGILAVAVFIAIGMFASRPEPIQKPKEITAPLVELLALDVGAVHFSVDSQGTVLPLTETRLSAEVSGAIVSMSDAFVAGGTFKAGDVLMRIDPVNYESALERAQATVTQRQIEYDGAQKLRSQGYSAEAELLSAKAALAAANADLVRAKRDLERTVVRVPYNGIVREDTAQLGDYVSPGVQLGTVFATDYAEVRLPLPDGELAFVDLPAVNASSRGRGPAVMLSGSYRGRPATWPAEIVRTEAVVDQRNRMVFAVARIRDPYKFESDSGASPPLPIGTFVKAQIDGVTIDNVASIPRRLVRGGNQVIFVDDDLALQFRTLDFLRTDADYAYVPADQLSELRVVTTTLEAPLNGMKVRTGSDVAEADGQVTTQPSGAPEMATPADAAETNASNDEEV